MRRCARLIKDVRVGFPRATIRRERRFVVRLQQRQHALLARFLRGLPAQIDMLVRISTKVKQTARGEVTVTVSKVCFRTLGNFGPVQPLYGAAPRMSFHKS